MARRRIDVGEITLSVLEEGTGDDLVVLLHGFPELAHSWRHQLPALAAAGYRAVAPDLRGYGDSDAPTEVADYAFAKLVGDIAGLIRALGAERAHVVGHDWGGSIAWALAARAPHLVRSLTILNSPHPVASAETRQLPEQQQKSWYMLLFQFQGVAEEWLANDDFANLRSFVFGTAAPGTFPPEDQAVFCAALARAGRLTAALNYYRANIPPENWLKPPPDLPPITVPTTIVWGEADAYMSAVLLERSIQKVTGPLVVERLPGVSHWVQQEVPDRVSELLVAALGRARG
jgi:pimeloyl-ACP methyl ester carboxylesterase